MKEKTHRNHRHSFFRPIAAATCGLLLLCSTPAALAGGKAYVVGGGSLSDVVFDRYINEAGGSTARVCVFGVNSSDPTDSMDFYQEIFEERSAAVTRIEITMQNSAWNTVPFDDGGFTFDFPEDEVRNTDTRLSEDPVTVALINGCNAIWFGGGNQSRGTFALLNQDGSDTPAAAAIRNVIANGGIFGGTSAGGAIQSNPMIVNGTSFDSLSVPQGAIPVGTSHGLGIVPSNVIVDQHFLERGRLGRLLVAMDENQSLLGVGVDEDTALLVDLSTGGYEIVGNSQIVILERQAGAAGETRLHLLGHGDTYDPATGAVGIHSPLSDITGDPFEPSAPIFRLGLFNTGIIPVLITLAVDTIDQFQASGLDFVTDGSETFGVYGVKMTFAQTPDTTAWLCFRSCRNDNPQRAGSTARYSVSDMTVSAANTALVGADAEGDPTARRERVRTFRRLVREAVDLTLR